VQESNNRAARPPEWLTPLLLGVMIGLSAWTIHEMGRVYTEVRVLQEHVSNTNAVLIAKGLKKPTDEIPN
jgi:hypothetical protein